MINGSLESIDSFRIDAVPSERIEAERDFDSLQLIIAGVQKVYKIRGFILKNSVRALFSLCSCEDIYDLALLSSELFDSSNRLFADDTAGLLNNVVLKGNLMTVLCLSVGENQLSIFLDNSVDCDCVLDMIVRKNF